jgi:tRNA (cytidine/uridine-2'-O-)-methyltransferase
LNPGIEEQRAMFHIVLYQPEIPPNTGNVIRLAANSGAKLHLVEPLGFSVDDRQLRRAGLDYHEFAAMQVHAHWDDCLRALAGARLFACSTKGRTRHTDPDYAPGDAFVFGPETRGLPEALLQSVAPENRLRVPMRPDNRSLNLSNAVAVVVFEAWRQCGFEGAA